MRFGIQLFPPCTAPEMAAYAKRAMAQYAFDKVWVPDHLTYENVFVILAAIIGQTNAHVGTSVVQPFSRTPVDLASSFAALAHLAGERGVTVGIGAGSPSSNMIRKHNRVSMTREMILFLREMFAGRKIALGQFPTLAEFFHLDPLAQAFLRLPPTKSPDIFVAAAGPKMLELAWNVGDGLIVSNLSFPTALVRQGALIQGHLLKQRMLKLPVPPMTESAVFAAKRQGKSVEDMVDLISDDLLTRVGTVIAGTPAECIVGIDEMLRAAKPYGFDIIDIASPLGPDWNEAIDLICQEIIPVLEGRSSTYTDG
jgi:5,10-methylenetetrahydromethanopterin reductase